MQNHIKICQFAGVLKNDRLSASYCLKVASY